MKPGVDVAELMRRALASDRNVAFGKEGSSRYLYRPHQLLVDGAYETDVADLLRREGARRNRYHSREGRFLERLGIHQMRLVEGGDAADSLDRLRGRGLADRAPAEAVTLNHVLGAAPVYKFGPGAVPTDGGPGPVDTEPTTLGGTGKGVRIAILDTGFVASSVQLHPLLAQGYADDGDDADALYDEATGTIHSVLGGHGTFIAGVIRQLAPDTQLDPEVTLDDIGLVDETELALDLLRTRPADIVNLSLAGPSEGDRPPQALARALRELGERSQAVYVAAAGNDYDEKNPHQKMWPAAFGGLRGYDHVVGVAAVDRQGDAAEFTNRGPWVRACAYGVKERSTYVTGTLTLPSGSETFGGAATAIWSGTSFAAPRVAAVLAATMTASDPPLTPRQALDQMLASAPAGPTDLGRLVG